MDQSKQRRLLIMELSDHLLAGWAHLLRFGPSNRGSKLKGRIQIGVGLYSEAQLATLDLCVP